MQLCPACVIRAHKLSTSVNLIPRTERLHNLKPRLPIRSDIFPPSHVVDVLELTSTILCSSSSRRLWMVAISHVRGVKVPATNLNEMV